MSYRPINLVFALLFLAGCFVGPLAAQGQDKPLAIKVAEFGFGNWSKTIANLDVLVVALQNDPSTRGFIVVYRPVCDLPGISSRMAANAKGHLISSRQIDSDRVVALDGGTALVPEITFELWVVPPGRTLEIRKDIYKNDPTQYHDTTKYDQHFPYSNSEYDYGGLEVRLDGFGGVLRQNSQLRGYIIGYSEPGASALGVLKTLRQEKIYLSKTFNIAPSRIRTINGGFRKYGLVELWLVPPGDAAPQPLSLPLKRKR